MKQSNQVNTDFLLYLANYFDRQILLKLYNKLKHTMKQADISARMETGELEIEDAEDIDNLKINN